MSDLEDIEDVFEGWLEKPTEDDAKSKGWLKKSFTKKWKKSYYVLRKYCAGDQPFLQWFDREEGWQRQMARGTLELFPRYKVFKRMEQKSRQYVFEISTDAETLTLAAESETVMDLWVIQLQMQTTLNPRVAGEVFRVKGSGSRQMQRIGAKDQQCLLHISRWGLSLALERTRAVLAQWPLTTIRNYEALDSNEFIFEAGRASPMGEGKYNFATRNGDDNKIFDAIDSFASARVRRGRNFHSPTASNELTEDDIERAYDQLRFSLQNFPGNRDRSVRHMSQSVPRPIDTGTPQQAYNHIGRSDSIGSAHSLGSFSMVSESALSYSRLERLPSWGSHTSSSTYPRDQYNTLSSVQTENTIQEGSYDRLARSPSTSSRNFSQSLDTRSQMEQRHLMQEEPSAGQKLHGTKMAPAATPKNQKPSSVPRSAQQVASDDHAERTQSFSRGEKPLSVVGSPNFFYMNAAYSSSVEVLPVLYATVDLSKKTKNKNPAERASDNAVTLTRHQSKSSDSILEGSPPKFTHFAAFATGTECKDYEDACITMIPPQKPSTERVSWAHANLVNQSDPQGERAEGVTNLPVLPEKKGSYQGQVEALERTLTEVSHLTQQEK